MHPTTSTAADASTVAATSDATSTVVSTTIASSTITDAHLTVASYHASAGTTCGAKGLPGLPHIPHVPNNGPGEANKSKVPGKGVENRLLPGCGGAKR